MDWGYIIKRTWEITRKNRFLWWLGILASFTAGGNNFGLSLYNFGGNYLPNSIPNTTPSPSTESFTVLKAVPHALASNTDCLDYINWLYVAIFLIIFLAIILIIIYVSYSAKAGLYVSVNQFEGLGKIMGFRKGFKNGSHYAWKIFGLNLLVGLIILGIALLLFSPVVISLIISQSIASIIFAVAFGIIALLLVIVISIYYRLILEIAERAIALKDYRVMQALKFGQTLVKDNVGQIIIAFLINLTFGIVFGLVVVMFLLLVGGMLLFVGYLIYLAAQIIGVAIYGIIVGLAFLAALFIFGGFYTSFISSYWTLVFRALDK
ncbi:MAG: hypothetical protein NT135_00735 [Candidatus Berkelbacteria bacterium]|nr:hypothetical protein [Candidatus Berkelbacteria bacterium]